MDVKYTFLPQGHDSFEDFIVSPRALWIPSFREKYSFITKLLNLEHCVILAHIRFNLKLRNLNIFEIFNTADQSWLSGLSNDVSIIFFNFEYPQSYTRFSNVSKKQAFLQGTVHTTHHCYNWKLKSEARTTCHFFFHLVRSHYSDCCIYCLLKNIL